MSGRSDERAVIIEFISSFTGSSPVEGTSSLYISGSPGTGKTALVNIILGELDSSSLTVININCMALNDIESLWERVIDELSPLAPKKNKASKPKGFAGVNKVLETASKW